MSGDPLWFKDATFYQLRVSSFYDSDGDGVGDLRGVVQKLDHLQDLGVTTLWLLPFYPSPLRDDGYDIADYTAVHPRCGTLRDFRLLVREAHRRRLRVVTELVMNHTSDQHPWFQRARRSPPGSRWRDFYVWSDTPDRYRDARIIFRDFEPSNWAWDPVAHAYYWHRFFSHQPDLNFDNPDVRKAMFGVLDFWLDMGVDGLRLDAVPYLYEREGTSCENLPETHAFLRELRAHVDARYEDRMLLAEANQWPEDAVAYFGKGDECHMSFHFPIMPRLFMGIHLEDRFPILDILDQTPAIPATCQWAVFLRNHDELTLEMVTEEERDYMWRAYARHPRARINLGIRRRLAPLLGNNRRRIELMNALLFSLPGTPIVYYGDEIGMGDNIFLGDRDGVRTPMQWSPDRNAGFSRANPQQLVLPVISDPEYHYEAVNVEIQHANPSSLLWWTKRILALRNRFRAFGRGTFEPLTPSNRKVLVFLRRYEDEHVLVVANLSRFAQHVVLDLSEFRGFTPVELLGGIEFPPIDEAGYVLTLGPHGFFWFTLEKRGPERAERHGGATEDLPRIDAPGGWRALVAGDAKAAVEEQLPAFLAARRWFRGKGRRMRGARIDDCVELGDALGIALVEVRYAEGEPDTYALPLALVAEGARTGPALARVRAVEPHAEAPDSILCDASGDPRLGGALLELVARRRKLRGAQVELRGVPAPGFRRLRGGPDPLEPRLLGAEQSNTSWILGDRLVGKLLRRVEEGPSVELELSRFLTQEAGFAHTPPLAGHIEIGRPGQEPGTLAVFHGFVPNEGDAWEYTLDEVVGFFEEVLSRHRSEFAPAPAPPLLEAAGQEPPREVAEPMGIYLDIARLVGLRTAELHTALASSEAPAFAPEPVTPFARRSHYQSMRNLGLRALDALRRAEPTLPEPVRALARRVLERDEELIARMREALDGAAAERRIRVHGDYHLGQLLYTGRDFLVIDFEGEPGRPPGERRRKRSPLADVAGMLRSFHYAAEAALATRVREEDRARLEPWAQRWAAWSAASFLGAYLDQPVPRSLLPADRLALGRVLDVHLLEKALYELGYELDNRPAWVALPLRGILEVLDAPRAAG